MFAGLRWPVRRIVTFVEDRSALIRIERVDIQNVVAQQLIQELQQDLADRYGGSGDSAEWDPNQFRPPAGAFFVAWSGQDAIGCAGVRRVVDDVDPAVLPACELKRMYVQSRARRRGVARLLLGHCEAHAVDVGATHLVLISGAKQPESLDFYAACGYKPTRPFGPYADSTLVRPLAKRLS